MCETRRPPSQTNNTNKANNHHEHNNIYMEQQTFAFVNLWDMGRSMKTCVFAKIYEPLYSSIYANMCQTRSTASPSTPCSPSWPCCRGSSGRGHARITKTHIYIYMYIHMYAYVHIHTCIHIYIYVDIHIRFLPFHPSEAIPVSVKHTFSGEGDWWEVKRSEHQLRGRRAVSAAGLQGKGSRKGSASFKWQMPV